MSFISLGPSNPNVVSADYWASGNQSVLMSGPHNVYLPLMPQNGAEVTVVALDSVATIVPQDVETITVAGQTGLTSWAVKAGQDCTMKYMRGNRTWYRVGTSDSGAGGAPEVFSGTDPPAAGPVLWIDTDATPPAAGSGWPGWKVVWLTGSPWQANPNEIITTHGSGNNTINLPTPPTDGMMVRVASFGSGTQTVQTTDGVKIYAGTSSGAVTNTGVASGKRTEFVYSTIDTAWIAFQMPL